MLDADDISLDLFPRALVPIAQHEIVTKKYAEKIPHLLALSLFRYLSFTINLEMLVVNPATQQLLLDKFPLKLSPNDLLDAYKIYCDEAYHALFCADMFSQVVERSAFSVSEQMRPHFLNEYERIDGNSNEVALEKFLFAAASEMMITSSLSHVRENQQSETPTAIRQLMTDHSMDEARHHVFYRDVYVELLKNLDRTKAVKIAARMPRYVMAFIEPDIANIESDLRHIGLSQDEAKQVLAEVYIPDVISKFANDCSESIKNMLMSLDLENENEVTDSFNEHGIQFQNRIHAT